MKIYGIGSLLMGVSTVILCSQMELYQYMNDQSRSKALQFTQLLNAKLEENCVTLADIVAQNPIDKSKFNHVQIAQKMVTTAIEHYQHTNPLASAANGDALLSAPVAKAFDENLEKLLCHSMRAMIFSIVVANKDHGLLFTLWQRGLLAPRYAKLLEECAIASVDIPYYLNHAREKNKCCGCEIL